MCTATWLRGNAWYELRFNRDESVTRSIAEPPRQRQLRNTAYVAPKDPDGGGTWLLVNQHGVSLALLNAYEDQAMAAPQPRISRGLLVSALADITSANAITTRLQTTRPADYAPYWLLAIDPVSALSLHWNGQQLEASPITSHTGCLTTSSYRPSVVTSYRQERFSTQVVPQTHHQQHSEALDAFHTDFAPDQPAHSVFMKRDDAHTVSYSTICVGADTTTYTYRARHHERHELTEAMVCMCDAEEVGMPQ